MKSIIYEEALTEYKDLQKQINDLQSRIKKYPPGFLRINHKNGCPQYYHVIGLSEQDDRIVDEQAQRKQSVKYIRKKDLAIVPLLAQKQYDLKLLKELQARKTALKNLLSVYSDTNPYSIIESYCPDRVNLIQTDYISDELYAEYWQSKQYNRDSFTEDIPEIYTVKGERVRSKSEKIIADTFERLCIPYRYEFPVKLFSGRWIHPDFMVLNKRTRKEYFWEHFGLLDNPEYCAKALKKLEELAENGILPGKNLIITAESSQRVLNNKMINKHIQEYLI